MLDIHRLPDDELVWQMLAALEAVEQEMRPWAVMIGLDPWSTEAEAAYDIAHVAYADMWKLLGDDFHHRLLPLAARLRPLATQVRRELATTTRYAR